MSIPSEPVGSGFTAARSSFRPRALFTYAVLWALLLLYVGSYDHLSQRGMREAKQYNMKGFYYESVEEVVAKGGDLSRHEALMRLYAPLNWLDRKLFGRMGPGGGMTLGLSK
jgi:hypothetical protein